MKEVYAENYKTLLNGIKEDKKKKGKTFYVHGLYLIIVQIFILPKAICRNLYQSEILIKISMAFFSEIEQNHPKIHMECQRILNSQNSLNEE